MKLKIVYIAPEFKGKTRSWKGHKMSIPTWNLKEEEISWEDEITAPLPGYYFRLPWNPLISALCIDRIE